MIYIFLIGLWLCFLFTPQNALLEDTLQIKEVETDDDKLNQALILVDILKTEYVKLLRQNILLRNGDDTVIDNIEQPTCAPNATETPDATKENNVNQTLNSSSTPAPLPPVTHPAPAQATPLGANMTAPAMVYYDMPMPTQLPYPLYRKKHRGPRRYFRRRIPDFYYYDIPRRRFYDEPPVVGPGFRRDYDYDPFNDTPTTVLTTPTVSTTTASKTAASITAAAASQATTSNGQGSSDTTTIATAASAAQPIGTTSATKTNPPATPSSGKPKTRALTVTQRRSVRTTASTITAQLITEREQLTGKVRHTPSLLTIKDPVDAEVASELVNELKEEGIPLKTLKGTCSPNPTTDIFDSAFKTSMRIFLEKSTRYPIPLPENHAFCYTNPNNPLCRTLIR